VSEPEHTEDDRDTAADRVPLPGERHLAAAEDEQIGRISLNRRQSRTIAPPRKWRRHGLRQLVCPECRAIVGSIPDGFWHLQTAHNQGKGVDLEAWGQELADELEEYRQAATGRRGIIEHDSGDGMNLTSTLIGMMALVVVIIVFMLIYAVHGG